MKDKIKDIITVEFEKLLLLIEGDFVKNYKRKKENFLVSELDDMMTAHLVFVSSFESKSGNSFQKCAREIAKLRYGPENVPQIINPNKIAHSVINNEDKEQILVTNVNIDKDELKGKISEFLASKTRSSRGAKQKCSLDQESIKELQQSYEKNKRFVDPPYGDRSCLIFYEIEAFLSSYYYGGNREKVKKILGIAESRLKGYKNRLKRYKRDLKRVK